MLKHWQNHAHGYFGITHPDATCTSVALVTCTSEPAGVEWKWNHVSCWFDSRIQRSVAVNVLCEWDQES